MKAFIYLPMYCTGQHFALPLRLISCLICLGGGFLHAVCAPWSARSSFFILVAGRTDELRVALEINEHLLH